LKNDLKFDLKSSITSSVGKNFAQQRGDRIEVAMAFIMPLEVWNALAVVTLSLIVHQLVTKVLWNGLWEPLRLRRIMTKQGVKALPFRFLVGQLPDQKVYLDSIPEVVPIDSYAALSPTVTPQYALFFPKFPGMDWISPVNTFLAGVMGFMLDDSYMDSTMVCANCNDMLTVCEHLGEKYFLYWIGKTTRLVVRDPEIAKELFFSNSASLQWNPSRYWFAPLIVGKGMLTQAGEKWATERRIIGPFFHQDALKVCTL